MIQQEEEALPAPRRQGPYDDTAVIANDAMPIDAMQDSPLATAPRPQAELDGQEELGQNLCWVSLDAPRGLLVCKNLSLEVPDFTGIIRESHVVRVMKDMDGTVFCASSNRSTADVGRPGRECLSCEDRGSHCFPRWWIARQEVDAGELHASGEVKEGSQVLAHTLSQTGTLNFTRYAARLQREGRTPAQVVTRLFVEEARRHKTGTPYRRLQFEKVADNDEDDPFAS